MIPDHFQRLPELFLACGVILAMSPGILNAVPPSGHIEGYSEYRETGEYPQQLVLSGHNGARVVIPTPSPNQELQFLDRFPVFAVKSEKSDGITTAVLTIWWGGKVPFPSALHLSTGYRWRLRDGDLTPIFGHIYRSRVLPDNSVLLTRVTERVDKEFRPQPGTRLIAMNSLDTELFWENDPDRAPSTEFDLLEIDINGNEVATIELKPRSRSSRPPLKVPTRKPMTISVVAGELLSARGRSYKVLNVVKPQDIKGLGRLVGWIEISANPVPEQM